MPSIYESAQHLEAVGVPGSSGPVVTPQPPRRVAPPPRVLGRGSAGKNCKAKGYAVALRLSGTIRTERDAGEGHAKSRDVRQGGWVGGGAVVKPGSCV